MTQDELILEINTMVSKKDLRILRDVVNDRMKMVGQMVKYTLDRGDIVIVEGGRKQDYNLDNEEGTIVRLNRTRAVVNINGKEWNVPFSMITKQ
jgi:ribosome maturation factor RimP